VVTRGLLDPAFDSLARSFAAVNVNVKSAKVEL
jgi:hypothetical protein